MSRFPESVEIEITRLLILLALTAAALIGIRSDNPRTHMRAWMFLLMLAAALILILIQSLSGVPITSR